MVHDGADGEEEDSEGDVGEEGGGVAERGYSGEHHLVLSLYNLETKHKRNTNLTKARQGNFIYMSHFIHEGDI